MGPTKMDESDDWRHMSGKQRTSRKQRVRERLLWRDGTSCQICGEPFTDTRQPTIDHIVEQRFGGGNELSNLRLTHQSCNDARSNKPDKLARLFNWRERYRVKRPAEAR